MRHGCAVTNDLNRSLAAWDAAEALDEAIEAQAEELLKDPQFVYDFLGDIGAEIRDPAVAGIVRAVMTEIKTNPALAHRYKRLALKEAECQLKEEAQCSRAF